MMLSEKREGAAGCGIHLLMLTLDFMSGLGQEKGLLSEKGEGWWWG